MFSFQWSVINEMDKLQKLKSLDCRYNPLMDSDKNAQNVKQLIIAKIGQLEFINKCQVCSSFLISSAKENNVFCHKSINAVCYFI